MPMSTITRAARVVEVPGLGHEALGVERPTLAMPGAPAQQPLPPVKQLGAHLGLGHLQMVAGHAFVVDRGYLTPRGERRDSLRYRPPHAARSGEVLARTGVVDGAVGGRREQALDAPDLFGDLEMRAVQLGDGLVGEGLHPVAER